jgi:hypothetical protein
MVLSTFPFAGVGRCTGVRKLIYNACENNGERHYGPDCSADKHRSVFRTRYLTSSVKKLIYLDRTKINWQKGIKVHSNERFIF